MPSSVFFNPAASPRRPLLDELKAGMSADEQQEYGLSLAAGADHPRAWVGPPYIYDLIGGNQFQLLLELGLRESHRFLDVGCGSLRLGRLAINYLLPGRYFGVEPNEAILDQGCQLNFGAPLRESQVIAQKRPAFAHNTDFNFDFTHGPVDFVFAQSIASHTGPQMTRDLLAAIARVSHPNTIGMVTFIRTAQPHLSNVEEGWFYPECVPYTDEVFGSFASDAGLHAYRSVWPMTNIREDGLISSQRPIILTPKPWTPPFTQRLAASLFDGIIPIN